jgi:hypothetical protein
MEDRPPRRGVADGADVPEVAALLDDDGHDEHDSGDDGDDGDDDGDGGGPDAADDAPGEEDVHRAGASASDDGGFIGNGGFDANCSTDSVIKHPRGVAEAVAARPAAPVAEAPPAGDPGAGLLAPLDNATWFEEQLLLQKQQQQGRPQRVPASGAPAAWEAAGAFDALLLDSERRSGAWARDVVEAQLLDRRQLPSEEEVLAMLTDPIGMPKISVGAHVGHPRAPGGAGGAPAAALSAWNTVGSTEAQLARERDNGWATVVPGVVADPARLAGCVPYA